MLIHHMYSNRCEKTEKQVLVVDSQNSQNYKFADIPLKYVLNSMGCWRTCIYDGFVKPSTGEQANSE